MSVEPFASIEEQSGKVVAACGHRVDLRTIVYWHCAHGVTALCKDCGPAEFSNHMVTSVDPFKAKTPIEASR